MSFDIDIYPYQPVKNVSPTLTNPTPTPTSPHVLELKRTLSPYTTPVAHIISAAHTLHHHVTPLPPKGKGLSIQPDM